MFADAINSYISCSASFEKLHDEKFVSALIFTRLLLEKHHFISNSAMTIDAYKCKKTVCF